MQNINTTFSQQNKSTFKWVSAGALLFGVGLIVQKIYRNFTGNREQKRASTKCKDNINNKNQSPQRLHTKVTQYSEFYFDKDMEIQNIETIMPQNPSVEDIYLNSPIIARDQFIRYTHEIRKRRRLIRKINQDQYINTIMNYQTEVQELLIRSRAQLLQELGMDVENFENMEENYEAIEDLRVLHRKAQQLLKSKLLTDTKQKKLSRQKLRQIIQQQIYFMENKMYDRLKQKLQKELNINQNEILIIIETLLEDIIYQKFGYEKQDISRKIQQINFNTQQLNEARKNMQIYISDFNFDSIESQDDPNSDHQDRINASIKQSSATLNNSKDQSERI